MTTLYCELQPYIPNGTSEDPYPILLINGHRILKQKRFKNKAQERAFDVSLFLASKKPAYTYSQRMGDVIIKATAPVVMNTMEVFEIITHLPDLHIRLDPEVANPSKLAHDVMKYVPDFFLDNEVMLKKSKKLHRIWFLEISSL